MNSLFFVRHSLFLFTFALHQMSHSPALFLLKVSTKLCQIAILRPLTQNFRPWKPQHTASKFLAWNGGFLGKLSSYWRWCKQEKKFEIAKSVEVTSTGDSHRVFFYVTNSIPYTSSGYAIRTHEILSQLVSEGLPLAVATRFGYPAVIGKLGFACQDIVGNVVYRRLVPAIYSFSDEQRLERSVDLLVKAAKEFGATIIHTTTGFENAVVASRAAERLGIPWAYEIRGEPELTWLSQHDGDAQGRAVQSKKFQQMHQRETEAASAASKVIVLSEVSKAEFIRRGIPSKNFILVPNGVNSRALTFNRTQSECRRKLGIAEGPLVGTVSSVVGYEGIDVLIRAVAELESVSCLIVGDGTELPQLRALARQIGVSDRILFVGRQSSDTILDWYRVLDLFVLPRKDLDVCRRVTPIKALQAQALGVTVVASDLPAIREVTGEAAIFFEPGSVDELAERISGCLSGAINVEEIKKDARKWAESRKWERAVKQLAIFYGGSKEH